MATNPEIVSPREATFADLSDDPIADLDKTLDYLYRVPAVRTRRNALVRRIIRDGLMTQANLARRLSMTPQAVSDMVKRAPIAPPAGSLPLPPTLEPTIQHDPMADWLRDHPLKTPHNVTTVTEQSLDTDNQP